MRLLIPAALLLLAAPAYAQAKQVDQVYACAGVTDNAARLACFDTAVAELKRADESGGVSVVSREHIEKAEKESFGLGSPKLSTLAEAPAAAPTPTPTRPAGVAKEEKSVSVDNVSLPIKDIGTGPDGRYRIVMENGQVWRQTDEIKLGGLGEQNLVADIRKAALGSFMMKIGNRSAIRVKRVE